MDKALMWVVVAAIVIGGGWYIYNNRNVAEQEMADVAQEQQGENATVPAGSNEPDGPAGAQAGIEVGATVSPVKAFAVTASAFKFAPTEIRVKKGDTVRITLTNSGGSHDWKVDEFNAATRALQSGETQTIEFVANKAGSFEYYCSVGTHRQMGMKGTLVVE